MKIFTLLLLLPLTLNSYSQNRPWPKYYINGEEFSLENTFINPQSIEIIYVEKDSIEGKLFITTKQKKWKYQTLAKLLKHTKEYQTINDTSSHPVYIINGILIKDSESVRIDSSYYAIVSNYNLSDVINLSPGQKSILIVLIDLTDKDPKKTIRIRGTDLPEIDKYINELK